jgi:hypothetical protein
MRLFMQHDWMIDVLSDLRTFAENHKMGRLAEHLEDSILMAASEMNGAQEHEAAMGADGQKDHSLLRTVSAG